MAETSKETVNKTKPSSDAPLSVIAKDTIVKGEMTYDHGAKVLGTFEGTITAKGDLVVAREAICRAQVTAVNVIVDGVVEGNIYASDTIHLNASCKMTGDLVTAKLSVAEGAVFEGHASVGTEAVKNADNKADHQPEKLHSSSPKPQG